MASGKLQPAGGRAPVRTCGSALAACGGKSAASPRPGAPADVGHCLSVSDRLSEKGVLRERTVFIVTNQQKTPFYFIEGVVLAH